jgi:hypothetical protein
MSVHVELQPDAGTRSGDGAVPTVAFDDQALAEPGAAYCYHVGSGGQLVILVDVRGESRVQRVYGPGAWRWVDGDVWRKGMLLQG